MSIEDRTKTVANNIAETAQEVVGAVTSNAKQAEEKVSEGVEKTKDTTADMGDKAKQVAEQVRDGLEEAKDNIVDAAKQV